MAKYRKALLAALGVLAIFIPEVAGLEGDVASVYDGVVGILTVFGVFQARNEPSIS
jgi:hypothetical protein